MFVRVIRPTVVVVVVMYEIMTVDGFLHLERYFACKVVAFIAKYGTALASHAGEIRGRRRVYGRVTWRKLMFLRDDEEAHMCVPKKSDKTVKEGDNKASRELA